MTSLLTRLWLPVVIRRAERRVRQLVCARFPCCRVWSFGATDIDPKYLAIWISTDTDAERDALAGDDALRRHLYDVLREVGYPAGAVDQVAFGFESQETVDREYQGNWYYAMK